MYMDWLVEKYDKDNKPWVTVIAHIRKNNTDEQIVEYPTRVWLNEDGTPNTYMWVDGNYGCDCNRELFFGEETGRECSEGRFLVNLENPATKEIFYREF